MSRFSDEMKVIPLAARVIAVVLYLVCAAATWRYFIPHDEGFSHWPGWFLVFFAGVMPLFLAVFVLLVGYVNGDALLHTGGPRRATAPRGRQRPL